MCNKKFKVMNKVKRIIISAIGLVSVLSSATAQEQQLTLKCERVSEIKTEKKLSAEDGWLMLSTDLYMLNPEALKAELETIYPGRKDKDKLKSVFISGQFLGTSMASEVRYPLYNLSVEFVNKELSINKSNTQSKMRVFDNLPLNSAGVNSVDIKFSVDVISSEQAHAITQFSTRQLSQIGKIGNDYSAMNKMSEEIGKLLEAKSKEQQYVFNSTIRLFNEVDADRELYSICIYKISPSNTDIERNVPNPGLKKCIESNTAIDYATVRKNIADKNEPLIVAVNYKSSYKPVMRSAKQINENYLNERIVKTRNMYASKLIDNQVYVQDDQLNDFIRKFIDLDKEAKVYKENKAKGVSKLSPNVIIDRYYELICTKMQKDVKNEFIYEQMYKSHYDEIMSTAKTILKDGKELESIAKMVNVLVTEKDVDTISSVNKIKENFNIIKNSEALVEETKWEANVSDLRDRYEEVYFDKVFKERCEALLEGDPREKEPVAEAIKKEIEMSNCKMCMYQAIEYYFDPLEDKINVLKAEEAERAAAEKAAALRAAKLAKKKAMMAKKKK